MKDDKLILGLYDVRITIYKSIGQTTLCFYNKLSIVVVSNLTQALVTLGTYEISTISMSSVLIIPQFKKSMDLVYYINHTYVLQCYLNPILTTNVHSILLHCR